MFDDTKQDNQSSQQILEIPEPQQESTETQEEQTVEAKQPEPQQESNSSRNIRVMREAKERAERERDEVVKLLQERERQTQTQRNQQVVQEDEDVNLAPDEIAEGKHLSKFGKKIKRLEDQLNAYHKQSSEASIEAKIKAQYPDFDRVVSRDNLSLLQAAYPELVQTIHTASDLYSKGVTAYTLIKKFGIDAPGNEEEDRLKKNMAKPRSVASISPQQGDSPLTRANPFAQGLTEDVKKQLYKEMTEAARNK
jgi:hypothetical protein